MEQFERGLNSNTNFTIYPFLQFPTNRHIIYHIFLQLIKYSVCTYDDTHLQFALQFHSLLVPETQTAMKTQAYNVTTVMADEDLLL